MKKFIIGLIITLGLSSITFAQKIPTLELYHGATCPHCHAEKAWFPELKKAYPDIQIQEYEVWNDAENRQRFQARMAELGLEAGGVPTNVIDGKVIVGFIPDAILDLLEASYGPPAVNIRKVEKEETNSVSLWDKIVSFFKGLFGGSES